MPFSPISIIFHVMSHKVFFHVAQVGWPSTQKQSKISAIYIYIYIYGNRPSCDLPFAASKCCTQKEADKAEMKAPAPQPDLGDMTLVDAWVLRFPKGCWLDLCLAFCFLNRRLLSCPKVKRRTHLRWGGGPPHQRKSWPCKGIWPPNLGWLNHPNLFSRETVPGPIPRHRWRGNMSLGRVRPSEPFLEIDG